MCTVKNLRLKFNNKTVTSINGQTEARDQDTKMLNIGSQTVNYFPIGIDKFFPDLQAIQVFNSKLKTIEKSDLKPFRHLKAVYLQYNEIEALEDNLFDNNTEIELIHLSRNKIKYIGANVFQPLKKLKYLYLVGNFCINRFVYDLKQVQGLISEATSNCKKLNPKPTTINVIKRNVARLYRNLRNFL
jgi:Leucine-rich repeat (LRR) protein